MKYLKCSKKSSRIAVETLFSDLSFAITKEKKRQRDTEREREREKKRELAIRIEKIKFIYLNNAVIADELPDAVEDEGEAHAKHN